jgi:O-antigen ligase
MMDRIDIAVPLLVGAVLFTLSAALGPTIGIGALLGLALLVVIFFYPIVGLALMLLAGTALQVLGSEHITGLPLSLGKVAGLLTLLAWIARSLIYRIPLAYSPQIPALAAFALVLVLATFTAQDQAVSREGLFRYVQLFLLFFMVASIAGQSKTMLDAACLSLTACVALSAIIGLLEFFVPSLSIESDDPSLVQGAIGAIIDHDSVDGLDVKRITGGLSDSNWFSYTVVAVLPLNLYLWHRYSGWMMRSFVLAAATLQSIGIVLSWTRSALLALGVAVACLVWKRRLPLAPLIAGAVIAATALLIWNPPGLQRLFSAQYLQEGSTPMRSWLMRGGIALIHEHPLAGYGYNQFGPAFVKWLGPQPVEDSVAVWQHELDKRVAAGEEQYEWVMPHNTVLQIWTEYGLFAFAAFTLFVFFSLHDLRVVRRFGSPGESELSDCLLASMLALLICCMFGHLTLLKIIWIIPGFAAALRRVALNADEMIPLRPNTLAAGRAA